MFYYFRRGEKIPPTLSNQVQCLMVIENSYDILTPCINGKSSGVKRGSLKKGIFSGVYIIYNIISYQVRPICIASLIITQ